ncbi:MAG TPA: CocE/NonD family hydrolase [Steroidobacteraceae bacterium]|jgi:hypothetical protein
MANRKCANFGHGMATLCLALLIPLLARIAAAASEPNGSGVQELNVMIPMRDGVKLATDVYRPSSGGKFATVLMRTPYNKTVRAEAFAAYFVSRGYAVVVQDVRGRYKSQGHWRPLYDDGNDGFDTTQWIGHQSWSDESIGTVGTSYEGGTQHAMAIKHAPYLKALIPLFAMSDVGRYGTRHQGAFELRWFNWVFTLGDPGGAPNLVAAERAAIDPKYAPELAQLGLHVPDYLRALPLRSGDTPLKYAPDYEQWLVAAMQRGGDDPFYKDMGVDLIDHVADYEDIPAYHVTGWYDSWALQVANINYPTLKAGKKSLQRLIVGPWTHSAPGRAFAGDAEFTADAAIDLNAFQARWFDHWLKHADNHVDTEAPVRIYVMGGGDAHKTPEGRIFVGGHWRDENEWPLSRARTAAFYLHGDHSLTRESPSAHAPLVYRFDPHHPVPTLGGNNSSQGNLSTAGATDQRCRQGTGFCSDNEALSKRADVVVFESAALGADMEVTGPLTVKLWAASDGPDTDFTAKLIDVYPANADFPSGVALNIGDGIVRARYRDGGAARLIEPGKPYEYTIELYPTSLLFKRGHKIRVDISSSNYPRFDANPNTGEGLNDNHGWRVATNSIYMDEQHPSRIMLPVIPP